METKNTPVAKFAAENASPELLSQPDGGRKPQRKKRYSSESIKKLEALGFDPLLKLIENHKKIEKELERQKNLQTLIDNGNVPVDAPGKARTKYSAMAHAQLLGLEQKLLQDMLPYRYVKVPTEVHVQHNDLPPIMISLTKQGDIYEIDPSENVDINDIDTLAYKGDDE